MFEALRNHATAENTANYNIEGAYVLTEFNLGDRDPAAVWSILLQVHQQFAGSGLHFPYGFNFNSNSYSAASMPRAANCAMMIGSTRFFEVAAFMKMATRTMSRTAPRR